VTGIPSEVAARAALAAPSLVGALIAGKYRLRRLIGKGNLGTVYKAENVAIGRTVAVKVLHGHLTDDGVTVARFQREARTAASIGHENIIEILDMGVEPNGAPFLVMEYVRGKSLERTLREEHHIAPERAANLAGQILAGLAAAHAEGIIHRDLSPANVLLTHRHGREDFIKLFDFGVAAFVDAAQDQTGGPDDLTPSGRTMGTPRYASPEQLMGGRVRDARVDLWAVGVLLYQMITGRPPFEATSFPELCRAITDHAPPSFAELGSVAPRGLEDLVLRALQKRAADRFQSAEEMLRALVPFGADLEGLSRNEPTDTLTLELRELRARERLRGSGILPPADPTVLSGEALLGLLAFAEETLGESGYARLLEQEDEVRTLIAQGIDADAWYPGGLVRVLERIDDEKGQGDRRLVAEAGRYLARRAFMRRDRDLLLKTLTPELLFSLAPELWTRYFGLGHARVVKVGRGYGRLEVAEMPAAVLARSVAIAGYLDEALRMAGARDVDVRLASAAALGDAMDVFEATWSS
jgi:serine/threonine protein kinase